MKPSFALTLSYMCVSRTGSFLAPCRQHGRRGGTRYATCCRAKAGGRKSISTSQSAVRGAGNPRKRRSGAEISGARRSRPSRPRHGLGQGTRLCRNGAAARRDRDVERPARRTTGTASVEPRADQDRQGTGCFAVAPLPGDTARRLVPVAARDLRCGQPGCRRIDRHVRRHVRRRVRRRVLGSRGWEHPAERIRERTNEG